MKCPECRGKAKVLVTRANENSTSRRWCCLTCKVRFSTVETIYRVGARTKHDAEFVERMLKVRKNRYSDNKLKEEVV